jgi:hypothetical protein
MAEANRDHTTRIVPRSRLSSLIQDPLVRSAFKRAERDYSKAFSIPNDLPNDVDFEDVIASDKPSSRKCHRGAASWL